MSFFISQAGCDLKKSPNKGQRILFVIMSRIGDSLLTTPLLKTINEGIEQADIHILCKPARFDIFSRLSFKATLRSPSKLKIFFGGMAQKKQYDLAIIIEAGKFYHWAIPYLAKTTIRTTRSNPNRKWKTLSVLTDKTHIVQRNLAIAEKIGLYSHHTRVDYIPIKTDFFGVEKLLPRNTTTNRSYVAIQAQSHPNKPFRNWPAENFVRLMKMLFKKNNNLFFLLLGSNDDKDNNKGINQELPKISTDLSGLSIHKTAALLSKCSLMISVDTGPAHLMSAFDKPLVIIYHCLIPSSIVAPINHPNFLAIDQSIHTEECSEDTPIAEVSPNFIFDKIFQTFPSLGKHNEQ